MEKEEPMRGNESELQVEHPSREEWVRYVYGDHDNAGLLRQELGKHLSGCPGCQRTVRDLRRTMGLLDRWDPAMELGSGVDRKTERPGARSDWLGRLSWAGMAAALCLVAGVLLGRWSAGGEIREAVGTAMAEWESTVFVEIRAELEEGMAARAEDARVRWREQEVALAKWFDGRLLEERMREQRRLQRITQDWAASHLELRRDLESLAKQADQGLRQARTGLAWLASRSDVSAIAARTEGPSDQGEL